MRTERGKPLAWWRTSSQLQNTLSEEKSEGPKGGGGWFH